MPLCLLFTVCRCTFLLIVVSVDWSWPVSAYVLDIGLSWMWSALCVAYWVSDVCTHPIYNNGICHLHDVGTAEAPLGDGRVLVTLGFLTPYPRPAFYSRFAHTVRARFWSGVVIPSLIYMCHGQTKSSIDLEWDASDRFLDQCTCHVHHRDIINKTKGGASFIAVWRRLWSNPDVSEMRSAHLVYIMHRVVGIMPS